MKIKNLITIIIYFFSINGESQNSSEIYNRLQKLNVLGSILYIAAHPDDENTRLISYFSNKHHIETTYLSLTRGDGGQNLIGTELTDALGLIRTQELLAARKIDGANQIFTTAIDFGYSKNPNETLKTWNKTSVLKQIVKHIRELKPDIIINRFDHRTAGRTHGHHTASAILSFEAFDLSSKENSFKEQLNKLSLWKPYRLFFNTSWFFYGSPENFEKINKEKYIKYNFGEYNKINGLTYAEIAAKSRSQHKSQGFGSSPKLGGPQWDYLELIKGKPLKSNNIFDGINISWNRINNGKEINVLSNKLINDFDFKNPQKSIPDLLIIYDKIKLIENSYWKKIKLKEVSHLILLCLGLTVQLNSIDELGTPNKNEYLNLKIVNPSEIEVNIQNAYINDLKYSINKTVSNNKLFEKKLSVLLNNNITTPYWLIQNSKKGMYEVQNENLIGMAETPSAISGNLELLINKTIILLPIEANYRFNDPIRGETLTKYTVVPEMTLKIEKPVYLFSNLNSKEINLTVTANKDNVKGLLELLVPLSWKLEPKQINFSIKNKGDKKDFVFKLTPSKKNEEFIIKPIIKSNDKNYIHELNTIKYPHILKQFLLKPSYSKVVKLTLNNNVKKVGYIMGAGDKIPESLNSIGIQVEKINLANTSIKELQSFKTIILGIRAFNTVNELNYKNEMLWNYVNKGGTLIIQYNTTRGLKTKRITPFKLNLSRDRVTDENSIVKILNEDHKIFKFPNNISLNDFEGWVQERGLYFPNKWDSNFEALLEMNDINEKPKRGSLLVASHGKGKIIYTGLSFFRELPAGIPGAFRLFVNLINYRNE
tara:strand:+ start:8141 stop:10612 length:2472 start_codon:yes stop_codon:yes gene_type:complete